MVFFLYLRPTTEIDTEQVDHLEALVADGIGSVSSFGSAVEDAKPRLGSRRSDVRMWKQGAAVADPFDRHIHVLIPVYGERPEILETTLDNVFAQNHPDELTHAYVVYEGGDPTVPALLSAVEERSNPAEDIVTLPVNHAALEFDQTPGQWLFSGDRVSRNKAAALTYAFTVLSFNPDDVITVFDSDTTVPTDTFRLAIAGMTEHHIVQAKQTVRNHEGGLLPTLEAMGIAAWSDIAYAHTTRGPYQLLGKAYFLEAKTLYELGRWELDAATEDLTLGLAAYARGYSLGIIDRYIQDICPTRYRDWLKQKKRWVRGPYEYLWTPGWSLRARLQFWTTSVGNQLISLTNVVGVPIGIAFFLLYLFGNMPELGSAVWFLVAFNAAAWIYYSALTYAATRKAVVFDGWREKLRFYLLANPITQAVYAGLWAPPILLAIGDHLTGQQTTFEVTPKE